MNGLHKDRIHLLRTINGNGKSGVRVIKLDICAKGEKQQQYLTCYV